MTRKKQQSVFITTNKTLYLDAMENQMDDDEILAGFNCPICGYPVVLESDLEVCYRCGWYKGCEENEPDI